MKLYIKQKFFTIGAKFNVYDSSENQIYYVEGSVFTFMRHFHMTNVQTGTQVAQIDQKLALLQYTYEINANNQSLRVIKELTLFEPHYIIEGLGWEICGDILQHDYQIRSNGQTIATIQKRWFTWADTYEIDINDEQHKELIVALVIIIDAIDAAQRSSNQAAIQSTL